MYNKKRLEVKNMIRGVEGLLIGSENPKKLADFYKDVVGLKCTMEMEIGEAGEQGFAFEEIGGSGSGIYITHHSKVKGKNKGADRIIFNLEVDGIEDEVK